MTLALRWFSSSICEWRRKKLERMESELRRGESESSGDDDSDDRSGVVGGGIMEPD